MSFKKVILAMFLAGCIAGCGFSPVYWKGKDDPSILEKTAQIKIDPIPEESGRILTQALKDKLNPRYEEADKNYTLSVNIKETINKDQGILGDKTSTRATFKLEAFYVLKQQKKELLSSMASAISSYNILTDPYSTITAEQAVRERLLKTLADEIALQITSYFKNEEKESEK